MITMRGFLAVLVFAIAAFFWTPAVAEPGLNGRYYDNFSLVDGIITFAPADLVMNRVDPQIDFWNAVDCYYAWQPIGSTNWYGVRWTGFIWIEVAGDYAFGTICDDGSQVWLDGQLIVDNGEEQWWDWEDSLNEGSYEGLYPEGYGPPDNLPGPLNLSPGYHSLEIRFYEAGSYDGIELWWLPPGSGPSDIPYYGVSCYAGDLVVNPETNWDIVPTAVLTNGLTPVAQTDAIPPVRLHPAVPNPFNPTTTVAFSLTQAGPIDLGMFDLTGNRVGTVASGWYAAGTHQATWCARDRNGRALPSGVYLYRLQASGQAVTRRVTLVR
jgi:hypothetical protein